MSVMSNEVGTVLYLLNHYIALTSFFYICILYVRHSNDYFNVRTLQYSIQPLHNKNANRFCGAGSKMSMAIVLVIEAN